MPGGTGAKDAVVDVWVTRLDAPTDVPEPSGGALVPGERERALRDRSRRGARRSSAAPGSLRHGLGTQLGWSPRLGTDALGAQGVGVPA